MLKLKQHKNQIVDKKRINQILKKIRKKSIKNKIDSKVTLRIWKSIIWSYVDYQRRKIGKKNNYLLCGGNFFSTNTSCFLV